MGDQQPDEVAGRPGRHGSGFGMHQEISGRVEGDVYQADVINVTNVAPGRSAFAPPHQIPSAVPERFVGRSEVLESVTGRAVGAVSIGQAPIVQFTGLEGIGKSTIGYRWALDNENRFPDGQLYVDLAAWRQGGVAPIGDILAWFLRSLGVASQDVPSSEAERAGMYRTLTHDKAILVMVDGATSVGEIGPLCPSAGSSLVLVTGVRMVGGPQSVRIGPLGEEESLALLGMYGSDLVEQDPNAARALCTFCEGHPLALHVCGSWLAEHRELHAVGDLVDRLDSGRRDILSDDRLGVSVSVAIEESMGRLSTEARRSVRCLAEFPGAEFDILTAQAMLRGLSDDPEAVLDELHQYFLVTCRDRRFFSFHGLVRRHLGRIPCGKKDRRRITVARRQLLEYYATASQMADRTLDPVRIRKVPRFVPAFPSTVCPDISSREQVAAWFEREHTTVLALQTMALQDGWPEFCWIVGEALWNCYRNAGYRHEAFLLEEAAAAALMEASDLDPVLVVRMVGLAGYAAADDNRFEQAQVYFDHAATVAGQIGYGADGAWCRAALDEWVGVFEARQGHHSAALERLAAACAYFVAIDRPRGIAIQRYLMGKEYTALGDRTQAVEVLKEARVSARRIDPPDPVLIGKICRQLALALLPDDVAAGLDAAEEAWTAFGSAFQHHRSARLAAAVAQDLSLRPEVRRRWRERAERARELSGLPAPDDVEHITRFIRTRS